MEDATTISCFTPFRSMVSQVGLPEQFTFPFYYEPNELSKIAARELQERLQSESFDHNFGLGGDDDNTAIGKMFGVLVVQKESGELGYLSAFSGKMGNSNHHEGFVPPVFDMLEEDGFFLEGIRQLNDINKQVDEKENDPGFLRLKKELEGIRATADADIQTFRETMRQKKKVRKEKRQSLPEDMNTTERAIIENELITESLSMKHQLKVLVAEWDMKIQTLEVQVRTEEEVLKVLKEQRKTMSNHLQHQLFNAYYFLNANGERKDLGTIFREYADAEPPAGSGECAAPKLLQYAFMHQLKPIAMAEFWWGASPKSEIRKHRQFYPSCRGKCEPILGHMLQGLNVEPNPMLERPDLIPPMEIVYEDDLLVIVNKPSDMLSVPGKSDLPSVYDQIKAKYPDATGPLLVHRLDMATSGILLFTKTKEANKFMQAQFIKKTIKKRYVALLEGPVSEQEGTIDLPIRLDLDDRPRQLVCYEHGKPAITRWKIVDQLYGKARVYFFPETGRTHQLRVHAAHKDGLNTPIVGDDLYGTRADRLHLHAEELTFVHPQTREEMTVHVPAPF